MDKISRLARLSVLRAGGFACLAILMVMMGTAHNPALAMKCGAGGMLVVSAIMLIVGQNYHKRKRIEDTEVWIMLTEAERPPAGIARRLIINAMRGELLEKSAWSAMTAIAMLAVSVALPFVLP
ncbi:MAG: hypothetical protein KUA43_13555 [Hoeflea sp.]|uniref:hypothetical protein n=1 Tax=Hoeflea sp. TaxID=1940281 RepID=UPI001D40A405|nr:hypothetical protein [Hoeflea sp.]MBU4531183.1 hypothetical protein [Alphaproteobacteria bacterium]MBU4545755.1 hypothetical protein [Alphaproteobacteria bacterium]MBU4550724.1 hypothetical protein [Alphaproteobacteria bacterium]MBV1724460.1 hypothetical protein [Hoeflea sp.]MBV1760480.1 hypothetical protein [Hoeflea sp.]